MEITEFVNSYLQSLGLKSWAVQVFVVVFLTNRIPVRKRLTVR